jgi:hypothetical protein
MGLRCCSSSYVMQILTTSESFHIECAGLDNLTPDIFILMHPNVNYTLGSEADCALIELLKFEGRDQLLGWVL